jgi:hypothetical protein
MEEMSKDELVKILLTDYKVCHDGYISRDALVPKEFHQMLQSFVIFLALASSTRVLNSFNGRVEFFVLFMIFLTGTCCLLAYNINIEAKASVKRALRKRMAEIEKQPILADQIQYWKCVVDRTYFMTEHIYKKKDDHDNRMEHNSASSFFVISSRILLIVWLIAISLLFFWDQVLK